MSFGIIYINPYIALNILTVRWPNKHCWDQKRRWLNWHIWLPCNYQKDIWRNHL